MNRRSFFGMLVAAGAATASIATAMVKSLPIRLAAQHPDSWAISITRRDVSENFVIQREIGNRTQYLIVNDFWRMRELVGATPWWAIYWSKDRSEATQFLAKKDAIWTLYYTSLDDISAQDTRRGFGVPVGESIQTSGNTLGTDVVEIGISFNGQWWTVDKWEKPEGARPIVMSLQTKECWWEADWVFAGSPRLMNQELSVGSRFLNYRHAINALTHSELV